MLPLNTPSPTGPEPTSVVPTPTNLILAMVEPRASNASAGEVSGKAETKKSLPTQSVEISANSILVNLKYPSPLAMKDDLGVTVIPSPSHAVV